VPAHHVGLGRLSQCRNFKSARWQQQQTNLTSLGGRILHKLIEVLQFAAPFTYILDSNLEPMLPTDPDIPTPSDRSLVRLQQFSDGIFVLAAALMVLQFDIPNPRVQIGDAEVGQFLLEQLPTLSVYLGTFLLLSLYWIQRLEQFKHCQRTDTTHLWLNILTLMFVVLVPYANILTIRYETTPVVQILYSSIFLLIGIFSSLSWFYASQDSRLVATDPGLYRLIAIESTIEPLVCVLAIGVALIAPVLWSLTFLLILPCYLLLSLQKQQIVADINAPAADPPSEEGAA